MQLNKPCVESDFFELGGDSLQINQHLPFASVNLLMALTLFVVLAQRGRGAREVER